MDIDYVIQTPESEYFDRKDARIGVSDLAELMVAFANTKGGTIALGISDKKRQIKGILCAGETHINELLNAHMDCCQPAPTVDIEYVPYQDDKVLLLHVHPSPDRVIRTKNHSVFVRIGDRTRELKGDELRMFEYSRSVRCYERELNKEARICDLDEGLLAAYKDSIGASAMSHEQALRSRGLMREEGGKYYLTHAALLLFAKNIGAFYTHSRVRFLRYEGTERQYGAQYNIVKDITIEGSVLEILRRVKDVVSAQLRDFTSLDSSGRFETVAEYPEFAWLEGIVNALTHREYAIEGDYVRVSMYDDHMVIESPGKLPHPVTVENIAYTRCSRNPLIARVLTEIGWVRELNEGVPRIYADMHALYLSDPEYTETSATVRLTLKNDIHSRKMRQQETGRNRIGIAQWEELDDLERAIIARMASFSGIKSKELATAIGIAQPTVNKRLRGLIEKNLVVAYGRVNSPTRTYSLVESD